LQTTTGRAPRRFDSRRGESFCLENKRRVGCVLISRKHIVHSTRPSVRFSLKSRSCHLPPANNLPRRDFWLGPCPSDVHPSRPRSVIEHEPAHGGISNPQSFLGLMTRKFFRHAPAQAYQRKPDDLGVFRPTRALQYGNVPLVQLSLEPGDQIPRLPRKRPFFFRGTRTFRSATGRHRAPEVIRLDAPPLVGPRPPKLDQTRGGKIKEAQAPK